MAEVTPVTVYILGNEFHVSSPPEQAEKLEKAAKELDKRMREIKAGGRIVGMDRIAVMAALNLAFELLHGESGQSDLSTSIDQRIKQLQKDIDSKLASSAQMELT
ncbi:cell division protein ZapA [Aliikangiella sp. G2MR2-5]|uniref:cell division protein ZapA n=1 Tax=Aliikangiella sp. G2MR2-5 TaxID=2788943 RepID=UPI0018A97128|nr:cell division protein ZapA [Aliikangiella sp. G2MR2-5]